MTNGDLTFRINVTGSYIVADEAAKNLEGTRSAGNFVLTTSATPSSPRKVLSRRTPAKPPRTSRARTRHRTVAAGPRERRRAGNGHSKAARCSAATRVIAALAKYNISYGEGDRDALRKQTRRNFTPIRNADQITAITPADQAEASSCW